MPAGDLPTPADCQGYHPTDEEPDRYADQR